MTPNSDATPRKSKDELQGLLREALKRKRPRWLRVLPLVCLIALGLGLFTLWMLSPPREPPLIAVVALDGFIPADTEAVLQGVLEIQSEGRANLADKEMIFSDGPDALVAGRDVKTVLARTDRHGAVSAPWMLPAGTEEATFILKQIGNKFRPEDRGHVLLIPRATRLCLVQIDGALTSAKAQDWRPENLQEITVAQGAAATLQEVRKQGFAIVYLAAAAEKPTSYQLMRDWIRLRFADAAESLPPGAVLSRFNLPHEEQNSKPWERIGERLRGKFTTAEKKGPLEHIAIAGNLDTAKELTAAGIQTLLFNGGGQLNGIERVEDWEKVNRALLK